MQASENTLVLSIAIAMLFLLAVLGSFLLIMLRMRKAQLLVIQQRDEAVIAATERERQLIALDLHDDISPVLTAARFKVHAIEGLGEKELQLQKEAIDHLQSAVQRIRKWADQLSPAAVLQQSPFHHLSEFITAIADHTKMQIDLRDFVFPPLAPEQSMHIHRMLQEIIHNAVKHAKADGMTIYAQVKEKQLIITALDDGIGFPVQKTERTTRGTGLQNLRTRARLLPAELIIQSEPGQGARHTIIMNL